jgi:hypothetical protein
MPKGHYTHKPHVPKPRPIVIPIGPSIAYVELTKGKWALIAVDDIPKISGRCWFYQPGGYAMSRHIYMHRLLTGALPKTEVDHANGIGLHNLPHNMRVCSSSQNKFNKGKTARNASGFKGVSASRGSWYACIAVEGHSMSLGRFPTPELAHVAYCEGAQRLHGEFARTE